MKTQGMRKKVAALVAAMTTFAVVASTVSVPATAASPRAAATAVAHPASTAPASEPQVPTEDPPLAIALATDKSTITAGEYGTLTASLNEDIGTTQNAYGLFIYDETTGGQVGICLPDGTTLDHCVGTAQFYSGGQHAFIAQVSSSNDRWKAWGNGTDIQATSNEIDLSRAPWIVTLSQDKSTFVAGESATLTATTNRHYEIHIYDKTTGGQIAACYDPASGDSTRTTCVAGAQFYSGDPHSYVALVSSTSDRWQPLSAASDVQATSNEVTVGRTPWTVTLTTDKTSFQTGDNALLTATASQTITNTNYAYSIFIYDETTGRQIVACYNYTAANDGRTCQAGARYASGAAHTYVAQVSSSSDANATWGNSTHVQATSGEVTIDRSPWSVQLTVQNPVFEAGDAPVITARSNQAVSRYDNTIPYGIFIYDETTGQQIARCWDYEAGSDGKTCVADGRFYTGPAHTYVARVSSSGDQGRSLADGTTDIQATSNEVTAQRAPWTVMALI